MNQSQASATTVYAYPPDFIFGHEPGTTLISFRVPALRCNVGLFNLRIWLNETPTGKTYDVADGVCDFEVVHHDFFHWWRPDTCTYFEDFSVEVSTTPPRGASPEAWNAWHPDFSRYDVIINNFNGGEKADGIEWPAGVEASISMRASTCPYLFSKPFRRASVEL